VSALLKGVAETGLTNLRVFTEDARFVLKALPDASLDRCFVLFADPWPKKRHNKRRIINQDTLTDLARVLTPSGEIYLATDDVPLAQWYEEVVAAHPAFIIQPASGPTAQDRPADWPVTRYEEKAVAKGLKPFYYRVGRLKKKP
jgi:tRNA (guanine-N7-)-methyltransferase